MSHPNSFDVRRSRLSDPFLHAVADDRSRQARRKVALVANFPPQQCGIATFTGDIVEYVQRFEPRISFASYCLSDQGVHGSAALRHIDRHNRSSYLAAAREINASGVDGVWVQHEYGIFGGDHGEYVCDFVDALAEPLILTLHTVLEQPDPAQLRILRHLVSRASRMMVMSQEGRELLARIYGAAHENIVVIEHGAPDRPFCEAADAKRRLGLADDPILMTFGLLGPGKGLETAICALPAIVAAHPNVRYRIVGATHPNLVAQEGEAYRSKLEALAEELGVGANIEWVNRFLETNELLDQLEACDIYLTPYLNLQQSTSGTLSYAVALGRAVVSTPYKHARELLSGGAGRLVPPQDSPAIAREVNALLSDRPALHELQCAAYERGRRTVWPAFAANVAALIDATVRTAAARRAPRAPSFDAVAEMTDSTGLLQHGNGIVADRRHGYCLDDNARALMLTNLSGNGPDGAQRKEALIYAAFLHDAWNPAERRFRNFMAFNRHWLEDEGSEDSNGRAFWALGHTVARSGDERLSRWAIRLYDQVAEALGDLGSPRAVAFVMLGALERLRVEPRHVKSRNLVERGGELLCSLLAAARRPDWPWFEAVLGYDNTRLPQALLEAGVFCGISEWRDEGLATLRWITERQTSAKGYFRPIGSETFGKPHTIMPFDQQPLEAQAHIEACLAAHRVDPQGGWLIPARAAHDWFFGRNDRGVSLVDPATGRCFDGITPRGINENSGAESILAFQLASHAFIGLFETDIARDTSGNPVKAKMRDSQPAGDPARTA